MTKPSNRLSVLFSNTERTSIGLGSKGWPGSQAGEMEDSIVSPTALADIAAGFGQRLHAAGVPVTPERSARFARVIALAGSVAKTDVYWLCRTTLVRSAWRDPFSR